jgi:hypothetical protein
LARIFGGGGRYSDSDLFSLEGLYFRSDIETSPRGLQCPDLSFRGFQGIWRSPSEGRIIRVSVIQEGATPLGDLHLEEHLLVFHLRLQEGTLLTPIYSLASSSEYLEALSSRAELLRVFSLPAGRDLSSLGVWHFIEAEISSCCSSIAVRWPLEACSFSS